MLAMSGRHVAPEERTCCRKSAAPVPEPGWCPGDVAVMSGGPGRSLLNVVRPGDGGAETSYRRPAAEYRKCWPRGDGGRSEPDRG